MKKITQLALLLLVALIFSSCKTGKCNGECDLSETKSCDCPKGILTLTGTLHRPAKGLPQIYLGEYGKIRRIDLKGKELENIENGNKIKITGYMRSKYFDGGTDADHLAMPAQWKLWIEVKDVEAFKEDEF